MLISGISAADLEGAREVASAALGNELIFTEFVSTSGRRHKVRLQVRDIDGPGARRHSHSYIMGYGNAPRRSRYACAHTYGVLFTAIFEREPDARIQTAQITYRGALEFLMTYQDILDRNIGSTWYPLRFGDECTCETDEINTDTLEIPDVIPAASLPGHAGAYAGAGA